MWARVVVAMGLFAACGDGAEAPTEIVVVVDTDIPPAVMNRITLDVIGSDLSSQSFAINRGVDPLPATLVLYPAGQSLGPIGVIATGTFGDATVASVRRSTNFVRGQSRVLHLVLWSSCSGVVCAMETETCVRDGTCRDAHTPGSDLPEWTGSPPGIDGPGGRDAGPPGGDRDAGPPADGGPPPCMTPTTTCVGGVERVMCDATTISMTTCPLGCSTSDPTRCAQLVSSYVDPSLFDLATGPLTLPAAIDTDVCPGGMGAPQTISGGGAVCVLVGTTVTAATTTRVTGSRPLVILATGDVTVGGTIDASSYGQAPGAGGSAGGASDSDGAGGTRAGRAGADGAGGGGGALCGAGGAGGIWRAGAAPGGRPIAATGIPPLMGGGGGGGGGGEAGGGGGGAVAIASRGTIRISGAILSGGGGGRAASNIAGAGGAGGGAGGMIALEAVAIDLTGILGVPGGGGAGGAVGYAGPDPTNGEDGGTWAAMRVPGANGGEGGGMGGGWGGASGGGMFMDGDPGEPPVDRDLESPGGGGGGVGCVILGNATGAATDLSRGFVTPTVPPGIRQGIAPRD